MVRHNKAPMLLNPASFDKFASGRNCPPACLTHDAVRIMDCQGLEASGLNSVLATHFCVYIDFSTAQCTTRTTFEVVPVVQTVFAFSALDEKV